MFDDVADFHKEILEVPPPELPTLVNPEFITERIRFMNEEIEEYAEAAYGGDIVRATDGLLDVIYVALGTLYFMGVPVHECWNAVQRANMKKVKGVTSRGNAVDAAKPAGWIAPEGDIAAAIAKAIG